MSELISIDLEWTSQGEVIGVGVYKPGKYRFFRPSELPPNLLDYTQVYHNGASDLRFGLPGLRHDHDTIIMSSLLPFESHSLEDLSTEVLKVEPWKGTIDRKHLEKEPFHKVAEYNQMDCICTYKLFMELQKKLRFKGLWQYYEKYSMPLRRELDLMELGGIKTDPIKLAALKEEYEEKASTAARAIKGTYRTKIAKIEEELLEKVCSKVKTDKAIQARKEDPERYGARFNLNSQPQVLQLFRMDGKAPRHYDRTKGMVVESLASAALSSLGTPLAKTMQVYRTNTKIGQFFAKWNELMVGGYLHPSFNQHTVVTGRLSASDPNIQQVPVRDNPAIRDVFVAEEGKVLVVADYSQIELRLAAHYSGDKRLIAYITEGGDFHGKVAKDVFNLPCKAEECKEQYPTERSIAKTIVYLTLYGGSAAALQEQLQEQGLSKTEEECKQFLKGFSQTYPSLKNFSYQLGARTTREGYLTTLFGRKVWVKKEEAMHVSLNYLLQGSASELTAFATIDSGPKVRELGGRIVALIHDEIIVETPPGTEQEVADILYHSMIGCITLQVPLELDVHSGPTWGCK